MDDTTYAEELQDHSAAPLLCPDVLNARNYTFCHWAKTVSGFDINSGRWLVVAVTCKRWGCPYCAIRKIRRLAWMSRNAAPTRLVTVTVSEHRYADGKTAWDAMAKAWPELVRWIRKEIGPCEYLRVLELQANGTPHFHCMVRSGFLLHSRVHAEWKRLVGKPDTWDRADPAPKQWAGVNIKKIDSSFATFRYLVKYLTKLHKIPWTDRHVSYSKEFFRAEDKEEVEYAKLEQLAKYESHPWVWLNERYGWSQVQVLGEGKWLLPDEPREPETEIDPQSLGLPSREPPAPDLPLAQRLVPGLEDRDKPLDDAHLAASGKRRSRRRRPPPLSLPAAQTGDVPF